MQSRRWIALAGLALCCASPSVDPEQQQRTAIASRLVELLGVGDTDQVASLLHYPPSYTQDQRAQDEADVQRSLDFLLERFGRIGRFEALEKETPATLDLGISGGTPKYYASLGAVQIADVAYSALCEHTGETILRISFFRTANGWEPWKVGFGLPVSRPDARALIGQIARDLALHMQQRELSL